MTPTIGFANQLYTMWEVEDAYIEPIYYNGIKVGEVTKQHVVYVQNLATELDRAINQESNPRRRELARRRLVDLGIIVKYDGKYMNPSNTADYDRLKWIDGLSPAYVKVTATIKHDNYNDQDETKLLRIKIIS